MSSILELTKREQEIFDEVLEKIEETAAFLVSLPHRERLDWLKKHQYSRPISFEREIDGTIYSVNAHFSGDAAETVEEKTIRILTRSITH